MLKLFFTVVVILVFISIGTSTNLFGAQHAEIFAFNPKGVVDNVTHCRTDGGNATEVRGSGCDGTCILKPNQSYDFELDFIASKDSAGLHLKVDLYVYGVMFYIIDTDLPNSAIIGGQLYTTKYSIMSTTVLAGKDMLIYVRLFHTDEDYYTELCTEFPVHVDYE